MRHFVLFSAVAFQSAEACTTFAAGKKATADGSVIVSHSDDGGSASDTRIFYVPAADHPPNSSRPIYYGNEDFPRFVSNYFGPGYMPTSDTGSTLTTPIGEIPEVARTFGYQTSTYGAINENNVAIAESTCSGMFKTCARGTTVGCEEGREVGEALMSIDTLSQIAMERAWTARQAVQLIGDLAVKYGFYGSLDFEGPAESLHIGDADEVFTLNILPDPTGTSAIWAARRVPDENVTVLTNMFTLREMDPNDSFNYLFSSNIFSVAEELGWWKHGDAFDFTKIYSMGEYAHKYYAGRRMWGGFRLFAPSLNLAAEYNDLRYDRMWPWSAKPDKLLTPQDFMGFHRDWYAGTPYDTSRGLAAGYAGSPDRFSTSSKVQGHWERTIALYRTSFTHVQQIRQDSETLPKKLAGVMWLAGGAAHYSPFVPVPSGVTRSITPYTTGVPKRFRKDSMNWATRKIGDICQIRFDRMHEQVAIRQKELEAEGARLVANAVGLVNDEKAFNDLFEFFALKVLYSWHDLADDLIFKFSSNADIMNDVALGYPDEWLRGVGYQNGPPNPPVENQCPPKCDNDAILV